MRTYEIEELISNAQILARVSELARELSQDLANEDVVGVVVERGGREFADALIPLLTIPRFVRDSVQLGSYHGGTESTGTITFRKGLDGAVHGKVVLVLEDIVDTGRSMAWLIQYLLEEGATRVIICTMLDKKAGRKVDLVADYVGFDIELVFAVGFGLDYDGDLRDLDYVGTLTFCDEETTETA